MFINASAKPKAAASIVETSVIFAAFIAFPLFIPDPESWLSVCFVRPSQGLVSERDHRGCDLNPGGV